MLISAPLVNSLINFDIDNPVYRDKMRRTSYHHTLPFWLFMYQPIQTGRLYKQIVDQIERRIAAGVLKVGDQLPPERELAQQFAVSRTAVREAVKALCEKGLLEIRPGRGTFVIDEEPDVRRSLGLLLRFDSVEGARSLAEVREILEPEIAALAATRVTDEYVAAMQQAIDTMDTALDNADVFVEADLDFHLALAEATQNLIIPTLIDSIIDMLREQRTRTALVEGGLRRGQLHHKKILEAVVRRNPGAARAAMQRHLEQVREDSGTGSASAD